MKKGWKKVVSIGLTFAVTMGMLAGCQNAQSDSGAKEEGKSEEGSGENVTLEVEVIYTGDPLEQFREVLDDFTEETGIGIELITPGSDYESVMKTRMASGDMPDVFVTHGWSLIRYKEYLEPLTGEDWYDRIDETVLPVISDENEDIYVLPVTQQVNGIVYNKTVLENAEINAADIRTMDDFMKACETIKAAGVTPFFVGGKDTWTAATVYNAFSPAYYTTEGSQYPSGDSFKDGSFDWDSYGSCVLEQIAEMVEKGYMNMNLVTADNAATVTALGSNECGFSTEVEIAKVVAMAPDVQLGIMPIPCTTEEGKSQYMIGEGSCFGIWKDTEHMDAAKEFLSYLSQPEVEDKIMNLDGGLPAMDGMDTSNVTYQAFLDSQADFEGDIFYDNLFDREYLPNGMYNAQMDAVIEVFMDPSEKGVKAGVEILKSTYEDKYVAQE